MNKCKSDNSRFFETNQSIYLEIILENEANEKDVDKQILRHFMLDIKMNNSWMIKIGGRPFSKFVDFQGNRYQILSQVKQVL